MIKKVKLTKKQVKVYEELSGFKTTGNVELHITDDATWKLYEQLAISEA